MTTLPLVCTATLHSLEESLDGERALCRNFVCRYVEMWPQRFSRIHDAVTTGHQEAAMDAALSLRSSSMMVGAARLGELAGDLIQLLECGRAGAAAKKLPALQLCGNQTTCQLTASYVNAA
ncbi:Hpt domain-containing protein [Arthrobacter sp. GMC3]|uniref:Hpt domain-containing protein n=1 Tax=Arthrobacter sp. GMC3 TaxID=2058894 RepID=UPI0015E2AA84|nr:Hpt domain-containing protein [Arthrobacter sp. GMC3]